MLKDEELYVYQIIECLVSEYNYQIIGFPGQKHDVWLSNANEERFPVIRLNATASNSSIFEAEYMHKIIKMIKAINPKSDNLLIINTNKESSSFNEDEFTQELANDENVSLRLDNAFPKIKEFIKKTENNDTELNNIKNRLKNLQNKKVKENRKKLKPGKITIIFMAICIGFFLLELAINNLINDNWVDTLIISGALYKTFIIAAHEYWRIIVSGFLHGSMFHLFMNMMALYSLGIIIESLFKKRQYIIILLTSIIFGNILCFILGPNMPTVGISGGLFGLMGAYVVVVGANGMFKIPAIRRNVSQMLLINLIISLMPSVSIYAHLGGFIAGLVLGFIFVDAKRIKPYKIHIIICSLIGIIGVGYLWINTNSIDVTYKKTDYQVVKDVKTLGITPYSSYLKDSLDKFYE